MPLFKDTEKLWKVKVIAARQADFSGHDRINLLALKGEIPTLKMVQMRRERGHGLLHCCSKPPVATKYGFLHTIWKWRNQRLPEGRSDHWFPGILVLPFCPACSTEEQILETRTKTATDFPKPFTSKLVNHSNVGTRNTPARNEGSRHHLDEKIQLSLTGLYLPDGENSPHGWGLVSCTSWHLSRSAVPLGAAHGGSEKSQCWDAPKGGTTCRYTPRSTFLAVV